MNEYCPWVRCNSCFQSCYNNGRILSVLWVRNFDIKLDNVWNVVKFYLLISHTGEKYSVIYNILNEIYYCCSQEDLYVACQSWSNGDNKLIKLCTGGFFLYTFYTISIYMRCKFLLPPTGATNCKCISQSMSKKALIWFIYVVYSLGWLGIRCRGFDEYLYNTKNGPTT